MPDVAGVAKAKNAHDYYFNDYFLMNECVKAHS